MVLQEILDSLTQIANNPASIEQAESFQQIFSQLLDAFEEATPEQVQALENPVDIENPNDFQQIILFAEKLFNDHTLSLNTRILAARLAFFKYQSVLPGSGLALDNPYMVACLRWSHRILDAKIVASQFENVLLEMKVFHAKWLIGIYARRNANALAAECYAQLAADALNSGHCKYFDVVGAQQQCIAYYLAAVTDNSTLLSPEVNAAIRAFKIHIAFCKDVPEDKKTYKLFVSPGGALQQLQALRRGEDTPPVIEGGATSLDEDLEEGIGETITGMSMWENSERWDAERTVQTASGHLGKLLAKTPKAPGEKPDYKQAAQWIHIARYCGYIDLRKELEIPEIQVELAALEAPTRAGVYCNSNNPASLQNTNQSDRSTAIENDFYQ